MIWSQELVECVWKGKTEVSNYLTFLYSKFLFNFVPSIFLGLLVFINLSPLSYKQGYFLIEFAISSSSRKFTVFLSIFFTSCNVASSWFICFIEINQLWLSNSFWILNNAGIWIDSFNHSDRTIFKSDRNEKNFYFYRF